MKKEKILKILQALEQKYTRNEIIELKYTNNYTLLLAVLLSAQAIGKSNTTIDITVDTSNSVYRIQARATTNGNYFKGEDISVLLVYMDI